MQWRPPGAAKTRACARSGGRGGEDEVARGRGRRRTGERLGGVVVQGGRGMEAAELGRCPGTAAEQEARMGDDGGAAQIKNAQVWRKAEVKGHI